LSFTSFAPPQVASFQAIATQDKTRLFSHCGPLPCPGPRRWLPATKENGLIFVACWPRPSEPSPCMVLHPHLHELSYFYAYAPLDYDGLHFPLFRRTAKHRHAIPPDETAPKVQKPSLQLSQNPRAVPRQVATPGVPFGTTSGITVDFILPLSLTNIGLLCYPSDVRTRQEAGVELL